MKIDCVWYKLQYQRVRYARILDNAMKRNWRLFDDMVRNRVPHMLKLGHQRHATCRVGALHDKYCDLSVCRIL